MKALKGAVVAVGILGVIGLWLWPKHKKEQCLRRVGDPSGNYAFHGLNYIHAEEIAYFAEWRAYAVDLDRLGFPQELQRFRGSPFAYRFDLLADEVNGFLAICTANLDDDVALQAYISGNDDRKPELLFWDCTDTANRPERFISTLLEVKDTSRGTRMVPLLKDQDAWVRKRAAQVLSLTASDPGEVPPLIEALGEEELRSVATAALGRLKDPRAVTALLGVIKDPHAEVRRKAVVSLGRIGDAKARPALTAALDDEDTVVRRQAVDALMALEGDGRGSLQ